MGWYRPWRKMSHCHFGAFSLSAKHMLLANQMRLPNKCDWAKRAREDNYYHNVCETADWLPIYAYIPHNIYIYIYIYIYTYIVIPSSKSWSRSQLIQSTQSCLLHYSWEREVTFRKRPSCKPQHHVTMSHKLVPFLLFVAKYNKPKHNSIIQTFCKFSSWVYWRLAATRE